MRQSTRIVLFAMLCAIWGSTWMVIKVGYGGLGPFNVAALRFYLAALCFAALVPVFKARWPQGRAEWLLVTLVGAALFCADYGLIYWGEQFIESGLTAILFATLPLQTAIVAHVYLPGDRLTMRKLGGTLLALIGVIALFGDKLRIDPTKAVPMLAIVGSAFFASLAGVATKRHGAALHSTALNATAMFIGAILLTIVSFAVGDGFALPTARVAWGAILYLALAGSVVTFLVYFTLMKTWNVTTLSFVSVFTPVVALTLGFFVLGERPSVWTALGAVLILGGVLLTVTSRPAAALVPPAAPSSPEENA